MRQGTEESAPSTGGSKKLGSWLGSKVGALGEHVKEMRDNTKLIVTDVTETVQKDLDKARKAGQKLQTKMQSGLGSLGRGEERIQVSFEEGPLGLELDLKNGAVVMKIIPDGQADLLKVQVKDRLVAIGSEPLPPVEENEKLKEAVKQRMKLPRPIAFTFVRAVARADQTSAEKSSSDTPSQPSAPEVIRRAEVAAEEAQRDAEDARREAHAAREEVLALRADLELSKAWGNQEVRKAQTEAEEARAEAAKKLAESEASMAELLEMREKYERLVEVEAASQQKVAEATSSAHEELERLQSTNSETLRRAELAELALSQLRQEADEFRKGQTDAEELLASSEARVRQLNTDVEALRAARSEDAKRLEMAESALTSLREEADALRSSSSDSAKRMDASEAALSKLREEANHLRAALSEESEKYRLAHDSTTDVRQESESLREEIDVLKASLEQKDILYQERVQEVHKLMSAQAEITQRAVTAETSLEALQGELSATVASAQAASEAVRSKSEADLNSAQEEIKALKTALEQKESQFQTKVHEADTLRVACAAATANGSEREGEASASAKAAAAAMAAAQEETAALREEVAQWKAACEEVKSKADMDASRCREEISSLKSSLLTKDAVVAETMRSAEVSKSQAAASQEELERIQKESSVAHNELDGLRMTCAEQLKRLEATEASLVQIREEAAGLRSARVEDQQKLTSLEDQLRNVTESKSKAIGEEAKSAHGQLERLQEGEQLDDAQTRAASAEASLAKLLEELDGMRAACAKDAGRADAAENLVKELRDEAQALRIGRDEYMKRLEVVEGRLETLREESLQRVMPPALSESSPVSSDEQEISLRTRSQYEAVVTELRAALARDIRRADMAESNRAEEARRAELAERLANDLRRDVQRLSADWEDERRRNSDAEDMLDRLRGEIVRLKSASEGGDRSEVQKDSTPNPSPDVIGMSGDLEDEKAEMLSLLGEFDKNVSFNKEDASRRIRAAMARIATLEVENQTLQKRIDGRPIVFQYGPDPEEEIGNDDEEADVEVGEDQENPAGTPAVNWRMVMVKKCSGGRRKCARCLWKCRQQRAAKNIERLMRGFTKMLLRYPILLWFFYIQLIVLWSLELWRQAVNRPVSAFDPAVGLEKALSYPAGAGR